MVKYTARHSPVNLFFLLVQLCLIPFDWTLVQLSQHSRFLLFLIWQQCRTLALGNSIASRRFLSRITEAVCARARRAATVPSRFAKFSSGHSFPRSCSWASLCFSPPWSAR